MTEYTPENTREMRLAEARRKIAHFRYELRSKGTCQTVGRFVTLEEAVAALQQYTPGAVLLVPQDEVGFAECRRMFNLVQA